MKIFDAYDRSSIRLHFKEYIEAEGVSVSKREQIYTRFGTYISRIRGVQFDKVLLQANNESEFKDRINTIFFDKWKNHIGYPEIPAYFFHYLDFLHWQRALYGDEFDIDGLGDDDDCSIVAGELTRYENRFVTPDGKLRLLANPGLICQLRDSGLLNLPISSGAIEICNAYYDGCQLDMTTEDWTRLIENVAKPKKKKGSRGDISYELKYADGETKICNSYQAMEIIVSMAGIEKVAQCNLRLNGHPIVARRIPKDKENTYTYRELKEGYFINNMGTPMDRFKVMRILISMYRLPLEINLSKEKATKRHSKPKESIEVSSPKEKLLSEERTDKKAKNRIAINDAPLTDKDFVYGANGTLNLFDDL